MARLHVPLRECGTGMTDDEVTDRSARVDLAALRAYWTAAGEGTLAVVHTLHPEGLDEVLDPAYLHQVIVEEDVFRPRSADLPRPGANYHGRNKGWFLGHLDLTHNYEHIAEALVIRGLQGLHRF